MPESTSTSTSTVTQGREKAEANGDWRQETTQLPSFYSPRARPADRSHAQSSTSSEIPSHDELTLDRRNGTGAARNGQQSGVPPPPSLLSPAFTPPATPAIPASASDDTPNDETTGVPVDSSIPTGGCGTKRPRLLETLPEVQCIVRARIPTTSGTEMFLHLYSNDVDSKEHLAIVFGPHIRSKSLDAPRPGETEMDRMIRGAYTGRLFPGRTSSKLPNDGHEDDDDMTRPDTTPEPQAATTATTTTTTTPPLVRIHSECYTGETAWSARCDCGEQLDEAARLMGLPGNTSGGIIIYLRQEGRGIGLGEKLKAYNLQDLGSDTVEANLLLRHPADARSYGLATAMLADLGQRDIRLLTNNPDKIRAVEGPNREIRVTERVAMVPLSWKGHHGGGGGDADDPRNQEVQRYIQTKIAKMGHMLDMGSTRI